MFRWTPRRKTTVLFHDAWDEHNGVTELVHGPYSNYDVRMHIALTRATAGVVVVCSEELAGVDERLGRLAHSG